MKDKKWYEKISQSFGFNPNGLLAYFKSSWDTHSQGASGRKLTGCFFSVIAGLLQGIWANWANHHNDWSMLPTILTFDGGIITAMLTMTTIETLKTKNKPDNNITDPAKV